MNRSAIFILVLFLLSPVSAQYHPKDWKEFVPLETNRDEVEMVLGPPEIYFDTYCSYETAFGKFHVWYSSGRCDKDTQGQQWNVPAKKMTRLSVYPNGAQRLEYYVSNIKDLDKVVSPDRFSGYLYTSRDESITYETMTRRGNTEFVNTIELSPSKDKQRFLCPSVFVGVSSTFDSNIWHGIEPLKSTRADVEKILGKPLGGGTNPYSASFKTDKVKIYVIYSTGDCDKKPSTGWNVPEFTVIRLDVEPFVPQKMSEFKLDESKYERATDPGILHQMFYTNETEGISLTVDATNGDVIRISYLPKLKDDGLKCNRVP